MLTGGFPEYTLIGIAYKFIKFCQIEFEKRQPCHLVTDFRRATVRHVIYLHEGIETCINKRCRNGVGCRQPCNVKLANFKQQEGPQLTGNTKKKRGGYFQYILDEQTGHKRPRLGDILPFVKETGRFNTELSPSVNRAIGVDC